MVNFELVKNLYINLLRSANTNKIEKLFAVPF